MCPKVCSSITVGLQVLHLLVDLLVEVNVCLEVTVLVLPFVLEGTQLLLELSGAVMGESRTKKCESEFLVCSTDNVGLAKLVNTGLNRGILHNDLELSIAHGRIKQIFGGSKIIKIFK